MKILRTGAVLMDTELHRVDGRVICYGKPAAITKAIDIGKREGLDALIAPEWALMDCQKSAHPYTREEKDSIIEDLLAHSEGSEMLIFPGTMVYYNRNAICNLLPIIRNGKIVYMYHKKRNGGDSVFKPDKQVDFRPGEEPNVFKLDGYRIGIEICADSGNLFYDTYYAGEDGVDLQVFVASGLSSTVNALKNGGLFFYSNGCDPLSGGGIRRIYSKQDPYFGRRVKSDIDGAYLSNMIIAKSDFKNRIASFPELSHMGAILDVYEMPGGLES